MKFILAGWVLEATGEDTVSLDYEHEVENYAILMHGHAFFSDAKCLAFHRRTDFVDAFSLARCFFVLIRRIRSFFGIYRY